MEYVPRFIKILQFVRQVGLLWIKTQDNVSLQKGKQRQVQKAHIPKRQYGSSLKCAWKELVLKFFRNYIVSAMTTLQSPTNISLQTFVTGTSIKYPHKLAVIAYPSKSPYRIFPIRFLLAKWQATLLQLIAPNPLPL